MEVPQEPRCIEEPGTSGSSTVPAPPTENETAREDASGEVCCKQICCGTLVMEPYQPDNEALLKEASKQYKEGTKTKTRSIQSSWFKEFEWLTYCVKRKKMFCYQCSTAALSGLNISFSKKQDPAFITYGIDNWKRAIEKFQSHAKSAGHLEAQMKIAFSKQSSVQEQLDTQLVNEQEKRRRCLLIEISSLRYLLRQGLSVRGHHHDQGNLIELLKERSLEYPELTKWIKDNRYLSPSIVNEIIEMLGNTVLRDLLKDIHKNSTWFAIIADETTDITNKEQLNVCIRWVDDKELVVHENPLGFFELESITANAIVEAIRDMLLRCGFSMQNCRGQAYDGASNMQGKHVGVATQLLKEQPSAIRVHCIAHCVNLALQDISKQHIPIRDCLGVAYEIIKLIKFSPKRTQILQKIQEDYVRLELSEDKTNLRALCPTRWTCRTSSLNSIIKNYEQLLDAMEEISSKAYDDYGRMAGGLYKSMQTFSTFWGFHLAKMIFSCSEQLSIALQGVNTTVEDARGAVNLTIGHYTHMRKEESFDAFYAKVLEESEQIEEMEPPKLKRKRRPPKTVDPGADPHVFKTPKDMYRQQYYEILEALSAELNTRFNQPGMDFAAAVEKLLIAAANGEVVEIEDIVKDKYKDDLDFDTLEHQLRALPILIAEMNVKKTTKVMTIATCLTATSPTARKLVSEVDKLVRLYLTIPVTSATSERAHSVLRRIKTYLRSTMTAKRFNNALMCHAHQEYTDQIELKRIVQQFIECNEQRVAFFGKMV